MDDSPLMQLTSHVAGKNAKVAIYPDRIEWSRKGLHVPGGATGAVLTAGLTLLATSGRSDTNVIPIRQIQGITTHKAGLGLTTVRVATAGDLTEFRVTKREGEQVKTLLLQLMNDPSRGAGQPAQTAAAGRTGQSVADELRKLADLRNAGVLTAAEFDAQKARLLGG